MRVLIGCESSGTVREAFRRRGHDAWSCDILPADDGSEFHIQCDVRKVVREGWDLGIFHPPCTHLAVSGAAHFEAKRADGRQQEAIEFFMECAEAPIPRVGVENPVCIMSSIWREPDQIIQPHEFGHPEFKATCLWLKGLSVLRATRRLQPPKRGSAEWIAWNRVHRMPPGPDRWKMRSKTYSGIADAFADQWGTYTDLVTQMELAA